ncbi:MAG: GNAT family N-acetyltransferase [Saprospiraceae bacterium]|nr:GNAT family N-acetyltransferase [Saprospiraceae bacterium]
MITIKQISNINECPEIVSMFDNYRIFYNQSSDPEGAATFLSERLGKNESVLLIAYLSGKAAGFTQLFHSFSSVSMKPLMILNDLYTNPEMRGYRIGSALLQAAENIAKSLHCKGLILETAVNNPARKLYAKSGWSQDPGFVHYGKYF